MILVVDNYDSFTYNLVQFLGELGAEPLVFRNDAIEPQAISEHEPRGIVISPGPGRPEDAGISVEVVRACSGHIPILGVCLGHQAIGQAYGGRIERAPVLMHGKLSPIEHSSTGVFAGINGPFEATRYHSLTIAPDSMPADLDTTANTADGVIMGVQHKTHPVHGVQFHPESIASEHGHRILRNFLDIARAFNGETGRKTAA